MAISKVKKRKYSLNERINYHNGILDKFCKTTNDVKKPKCAFSFGYLQAVERGRPLDYDNQSIFYKKGVDAGLKAKRKSELIRF